MTETKRCSDSTKMGKMGLEAIRSDVVCLKSKLVKVTREVRERHPLRGGYDVIAASGISAAVLLLK